VLLVSPARPSGGSYVPAQVELNRRRYYRLEDGTQLPSVTTILSLAISKPALIGWAAKTVAQQAMDNLPRLIRMSRGEEDEAVKWLKGRPYAQRDEAANAGTAAHAVAEAHILGQPYVIPEPGSPAGKTLAQFQRFLADWSPEFEATEAVVTNETYGYAGTLDALARIPALGDHLVVLDYKTGKTGPYAEWALQTVAYMRGEYLWLKDGTKTPMPTAQGVAVLRLRPNGYALHVLEGDLDKAFQAFAAAAVLAGWVLDTNDSDPWSIALPTPAMEVTEPCPS
jgi:hypothetical protein